MKKYLLILLLVALPGLRADIVFSDFISQPITLSTSPSRIDFGVSWNSEIYPVVSDPGRLELINSNGNLVGSATAHLKQSGAVVSATIGTVNPGSSRIWRLTADLSVADGDFSGNWELPALPAGNYTLRLWRYDTQYNYLENGTVHTTTSFGGITALAPPVFTLFTTAGPGGTVSPGGSFLAATWVTVTAAADGQHDFSGWSGDAGGSSNPLSLPMTGDRTVQANFILRTHVLTTSAGYGGSVTPGGTYPHGTQVTLNATPDGTHRFVGWVGDIIGSIPNVTVLMDGPKSVQAFFADKLNQSIDFPALASLPPGGSVTLTATASSGLPVAYTIVSGPGQLSGTTLILNGSEAVVIQAQQAGNGIYLPAPSIIQTVQPVTVASMRYQNSSRTLLQDQGNSANYLLTVQP